MMSSGEMELMVDNGERNDGRWRKLQLGDIAVISYGYTAKASIENVGSKFLRITDIQNDMVNWSSVPYCPVNEDDFKKYKLIDQDIVFARTGATTGKSYLVCDPPEAVAASYLIRLRLKDSTIDAKFISKYFQTKEYWDNIFSGISGSAQGGFNASKLSELVIPIPPLLEQKRIVAIADEAFEGIDRAIRNTEKNLSNARELFESYLNTIFTQKGDGWEEKKLEDVCQVIGGGTPSKANQEFYTGEIPWATVRDMKNEIISKTEFRITQEAVKKSSTNIIKMGNVVIATRVGLGKVCMLSQDTAINQDLKGIIPKDNDQISIRFLFWWLKSIAYLIKNEGTGATVQGVKVTFIHSLKIPVSTLTKQKQIVVILDEISNETQRLENIYRQKIAALKELKQSILQKAFTGELTADKGEK